MQKVLNVGGNTKHIALPPFFQDWEHVLLDIDPSVAPDVLCDAREMQTLPAAQYDAIYCSHNLEHYYAHEVPRVLAGFRHVLKNSGFVHVRVPDLGEVVRRMVVDGLDLEDVLYHAKVGPVLVQDVIFGWGQKLASSGEDYFAHRYGYTVKSLPAILARAGFSKIVMRRPVLELEAFAFIAEPTPETLQMLGFATEL